MATPHDSATDDFARVRRAPGLARRVLVLHSPDDAAQGRAKVLSGDETIRLGRIGSDISLDAADARLSREHCALELDPGGWRLRDLGSRNGTFRNGQRVTEARLTHSDVIRIGDHLLLYQELAEHEALALLSERRDGSPLEGTSAALASLRLQVEQLAPLQHPVLLLGETGVGKEVVARALHARRCGATETPFVAINCAALPRAIAETELFGHARGAFTDAAQSRLGLFREAGNGTLFLDEIGELPPALQATLLRALETRELRPVGSDKSVPFAARIIAATNRDLDLEIERGGFRSDLFARLMTHVLTVPPLRRHKDDILPLLASFLRAGGAPQLRPSADAAEALLLYGWPRNVRELRQLATRWAANSSLGARLDLEQLPAEIAATIAGRHASDPAPALDVPAALLEIPRDRAPSERELRAVLQALDRNMTRVAEFFGKDRRQVYRWCERFGIPVGD